MFNNIGEKIKEVASLIFWLGTIASVILGGVAIFSAGDFGFVIMFVVLFVGFIISWASSFLLYGYGELIEKTSGIYNILQSKFCGQVQGSRTDIETKLDEWKAKGLITEEEYQAKKEQLESEVHE